MKKPFIVLGLLGLAVVLVACVAGGPAAGGREDGDRMTRDRRTLAPGEILTVAGGATLNGQSNPRQVSLIGLCALAADNERDLLYISDSTLHQILRVDFKRNRIAPLAGTEFGGYNGDGKPGSQTEFQVPCDLAVHPKTGDVYLVDTNNYRVRAVARDGSKVWTVAGLGVEGVPERQLPTVPPVGPGLEFGNFSGDGGPPEKAELNLPAGVVFDADGNLFISDTANNRVRVVNNGDAAREFAGVKVEPGTIQTIAGRGEVGYSGDGGKAVDALIAHPREIVVDRQGDIWFVDTLNEALRRINGKTGIIETVVRTRNDPWKPDTEVLFPPSISGLAIAPNGDIYYSNLNRHAVFRITPGDPPELLAGVGVRGATVEDGPATRVPVSGPGALAIGRRGEIYVVEQLANVVRKIENGRMRTVAGGGSPGEGVPATEAFFSIMAPIQVGPGGDLYIGDLNLQSIRRVLADSGIVETFAGGLAVGSTRRPEEYRITRHARATNLDFDGPDRLYISDGGLNVVRRFDRTAKGWTVDIFAGNGVPGNGGDGGPATQAELSVPIGLALDHSRGGLVIAGIYHPKIRIVDRLGVINELAGNGIAGYSGDGGPAAKAQFDWPTGVDFDREGNLFIADFFNNRIRRVARDGVVTTFAGTGEPGYSGDGGPAAQAQLYNPVSLVLDEAGNIYVADGNNHVVRRIDAKSPHVISTVAGTGQRGFSGDGGPAVKARLNVPRGIALDQKEKLLYIADSLNRRVRVVRLPS
jgi:sugar lactone lactonase YvrE